MRSGLFVMEVDGAWGMHDVRSQGASPVPETSRRDCTAGRLRRLEGSYAIAAPAQHMLLPWPGLEHIGWASVVVLSAPWDFLMLGTLAALLRQRYADLIWVRLTAQD